MAAEFRVLVTDRAWPDCNLERDILATVGAIVVEPPNRDEATFVDLAPTVDAIATCWAKVTSPVVKAATRCQVIARFGIGLDNIALATATERRIPVTYVPDYCVPEVSDHTLALILACARKIAFFHLRTKGGEYNLQAGYPLRRIQGQTLGLVGLGRIARALVPKARAFGFNVVATSPSGNDHGLGCRMVSLEELLRDSDYVSLHLPLNQQTAHLLGSEQFSQMKPTAFVVNTSRGGLIDHAALWQALQEERIAGAALDVFEPEPPDLSQPLFRDPRVIVTPHAAFLSSESLEELRARTARQVADVLSGKRPEHVANPEVYENR